MIVIKTLLVGDLTTNCYLISDPDTKETVIIDPGDDADFITQTVLDEKLKPTTILLTHGHFDHVLGCLELKLNLNIPILLHEKDKKIYTSANQSALHWLKKKTLKVPPIDQFIKEGDQIKIGNEVLTVIETPGHTPGSICLFYLPSAISHLPILFTGDTLFKDGLGRTDFSYSSPSDLAKSLARIFDLKSNISNLGSNITVYPGHGLSTTLSECQSLVQP